METSDTRDLRAKLIGSGVGRRLPFFLVLNNSSVMQGERARIVHAAAEKLISEARSDPMFLETAWMSVVLWGATLRQLVPLTDVPSVALPDFQIEGEHCREAPIPDMAAFLAKVLSEEVRPATPQSKGDWKPVVVIMTHSAAVPDRNLLVGGKRYGMAVLVAGDEACEQDQQQSRMAIYVPRLDAVKDSVSLAKCGMRLIVSCYSVVARCPVSESTPITGDLPPPPSSILPLL